MKVKPKSKSRVIHPYSKGYGDAGASLTKRALRGFNAQSGAPIEDIDFHNSTLRQRGRMLYMSTPVAAAAVNTNRTKIVGSGLRMRCVVNRDVIGLSEEAAIDWQRNTEAEWHMWAGNKFSCDALGINNFYELQQVALKSWLTSGDVFALLKRDERTTPLNPYTLRIHLIEADRVRTPHKMKKSTLSNNTEGETDSGNLVHDGVEVDDSGRVVAYHICNVYPNELTSRPIEWSRVLAVGEKTGLPNILHIMESDRADQYRGVTFLAPAIEVLLQFRRYTESELTAALVQSFFTAWITTEAPATVYPFAETGAGDYEGLPADEPDSITEQDTDYEMGPGTVNVLNPGEKVTLGNPNIPTAGFETFFKTICRLIGAALEIPYDVLIKEFNASYSAAKGALEEAWETMKMRRSWFISDFCQPVYEVWLAEAVATGRIKAPGFFTDPRLRAAWCGTRWDGPAQTHLDPVKEAKANEMLVIHGWKTNEQVTRESYGGNWEENAEAVIRENELKEKMSVGAVQNSNISPTNDDDDDQGDDNNA